MTGEPSASGRTNGAAAISSKDLGRLRGRLLDQIHDDPEMTPADQSVCYGIARRLMAQTGGTARISNDDLVKLTHRDLRTVKRAIKNAIEHGHFKLESRCRGDRVFIPVIKEAEGQEYTSKPQTIEGQKSPSNDNDRGAKMPPDEGDKCPRRGAEHHQQTPAAQGLLRAPSLITSLNPSLERAPAAPESSSGFVDDCHELWSEGVAILETLGMTTEKSKRMIGRWLKDTKNDHRRVYNAIAFARDRRTRDPIPLITGALQTERRSNSQPTPDDHKVTAIARAIEHARRRQGETAVAEDIVDVGYAVVGGGK